MTSTSRYLKVLGVFFALLVLVMVGFLLFKPTNVKASTPSSPLFPQGDQPNNAYCLSCHQQPNMTYTLPNGEELYVTIDPQAYGASAHGMANLSCVTCHTDISTFPHPENPDVQTLRDYTLMYQDTCKQCHQEQYEQLHDSVHANVPPELQDQAPTCVDCHNPHTQASLMENGQLKPGAGAAVAETCARCHNAIFEEYKNSVHGAGVLQEGNPDTPTCTDCHGVHDIANPNTAQFRLNSPELCAGCHTNTQMMEKYGLSTQVLNTYVSDFHGTTVELFARTSPNVESNKPVCYDCHGVHNIASVSDPQRGIQIEQNMLQVCQRCHPNASQNFPASWMSHYIPSPTHYPIVFYVDWFYRIFIPAVLGGMAVFVVADLGRRLHIWGRRRPAPVAEETKKEEE